MKQEEIVKRIEKTIFFGDKKMNTRYPMQTWKLIRTKLKELLTDIKD
tara:strand:+ start:363 stop:503 length:141 start_codon:yes stop_codon:yes gene_type:complete